jgi:DNA-directed RNA polymerase specialized sigma24 family protein
MMLWFLMLLTRRYLRALDRWGGQRPEQDEDDEAEQPGGPAGRTAAFEQPGEPPLAALEAEVARLQALLAAGQAEEREAG